MFGAVAFTRPPADFRFAGGTNIFSGDERSSRVFQLVDKALDDAHAAVPELIRGVEAERRQKLLVAQCSARLQHLDILVPETIRGFEIDVIEAIHQAIPESVGVDVKGE